MILLGRNHHTKAFVCVYVRSVRIEYTVHVARLKTAIHGAWRSYPDATSVEVSRKQIIHWSKTA